MLLPLPSILPKSVFQLAVADASWRVIETHRLTRSQFERWFANRDVRLVVMEACGSAHHWARWLTGLGSRYRLLPARYVRAYVKRNKTDAADARRCSRPRAASDIAPGARQIDRAAGAAGSAPHPLPVDGHAHVAHQCAARLLPRVRHRHRRWQPHRASSKSAACWPIRIPPCRR